MKYTKQELDSLLEKAKNLYQVGCTVSNVNLGWKCVFIINEIPTFRDDINGDILIVIPSSRSSYTVYTKGRWADITKYPKNYKKHFENNYEIY